MMNGKVINPFNTKTVNDINWTPVFRDYATRTGSSTLDEMGLNAGLGHISTAKNGKKKLALTLRLGGGVVSTLGWKDGDCVIVCYDPDDLYNVCVMKHEKGYKLVSENKTKFAASVPHRVNLNCSWLTMETDRSKCTPQEITIDKKLGRIFFRLNVVR